MAIDNQMHLTIIADDIEVYKCDNDLDFVRHSNTGQDTSLTTERSSNLIKMMDWEILKI